MQLSDLGTKIEKGLSGIVILFCWGVDFSLSLEHWITPFLQEKLPCPKIGIPYALYQDSFRENPAFKLLAKQATMLPTKTFISTNNSVLSG
tara:strand:+ start:1511 stop:1783 length:273 start_codon:yes stop_codon:yes gene_type:complete